MSLSIEAVLSVSTMHQFRPMRLLRIREPFDHPHSTGPMKFDGFRALAHVNCHHCQLVSRNGHIFKSWPYLAERARTPYAPIARCSMARSSVWMRTAAAAFTIYCSVASSRTSWRLMPCRLMAGICAHSPSSNGTLARAHHAARRVSADMSRCQSSTRLSCLFDLACERDLEGYRGEVGVRIRISTMAAVTPS